MTLTVARKPGKDFRRKRGTQPGNRCGNDGRAVVVCEADRAFVLGSAADVVVMSGENESDGKQRGQEQHPEKLLSQYFL